MLVVRRSGERIVVVLEWNRAAAHALIDFAKLDEADRNIVLIMMTSPDAKRAFGPTWSREAKRVVAQFRTAYDIFARDPAFEDLVQRLGSNLVFTRWWNEHDVTASVSGTKTIRRNPRSTTSWVHSSFQSNDDPNLRLVIYAPV